MKLLGFAFWISGLLFLAPDGLADIVLPAIFSDHMVLQNTGKVPIWGEASPNEKIKVTLGAQAVEAIAGSDGKWRVYLDLSKVGPGPFQVLVEGQNKIVIADVAVGEVWVAGGQSNMEFRLLQALGGHEEIAQSANPSLRQFTVIKNATKDPQDKFTGKWIVASPSTSAAFTAVGYFFGREIQHELNLPVGIISDNWGGTPCEAWTSREALESMPGISARLDAQWQDLETFNAAKPGYLSALAAWLKAQNRDDGPPAHPEKFLGNDPSVKWISVNFPGPIAGPSLPKAGIFWLKRDLTLTAGNLKDPMRFDVTPVNAYEALYCNGQLVEAITPQDFGEPMHRHTIPLNLLKEGANTIALRVLAPTAAPALTLPAAPGAWQVAVEKEYPALDAAAEAALPKAPLRPVDAQHIGAALYNGMIHPILSYAIKGVIWYQGEENVSRAYDYRTAFPLMINDWRKQWGQGDFPFYFCQLANYLPKSPLPGESKWAELREAQSSALSLPRTAQAVLIDVGDANDIHPRNKKTPGERLALIALARDYGRPKLIDSGPVYQSMTVEGGKIRLTFKPGGDGLVAQPVPAVYSVKSASGEMAPLVRNSPNSELEGFSICGPDHRWIWAQAKIEGKDVLVWSDNVSSPEAVRYDWADNPNGNLYGASGLPASPFRTDDFPEITRDTHY